MSSYFSNGETINNKIRFVKSYNTRENRLTYPNSRKIRRLIFVRKVNAWLEQYNYPTYLDFENTIEFEKSLEYNNAYLVKNITLVGGTINKICKLIQKKYKIKDEYQFKEDLCYFLYSISSEPK